MREELELNREHWDEATRLHTRGNVYGLEDFITVLSATTDNVALLDAVRERHGNDPFQWLPVLLREVHDRRFRTSRRAA